MGEKYSNFLILIRRGAIPLPALLAQLLWTQNGGLLHLLLRCGEIGKGCSDKCLARGMTQTNFATTRTTTDLSELTPQQTATVVTENVEPNTTNHDSGTSLSMQLEPNHHSESDHHTLVVEYPLETTKLAAQSQQQAPSWEACHELPRAPCHFSNDDECNVSHSNTELELAKSHAQLAQVSKELQLLRVAETSARRALSKPNSRLVS
jgi:hypothetical protein